MNVIVTIEDNIYIKTIMFKDAIFKIIEDRLVEIRCVDSSAIIGIFNLDKIIGVHMI